MSVRSANGTVPPLGELFPFPLDGFQLEAIDALNIGHSVVVRDRKSTRLNSSHSSVSRMPSSA